MEKASKSLVKELKKQKRENDFLLFLDNPKIIRDAINSGLKPLIAFVTKKTQDCKFDCKTYIVEDSILKELTDVKTPQDLCVVLEYKSESLKVPKKNFDFTISVLDLFLLLKGKTYDKYDKNFDRFLEKVISEINNNTYNKKFKIIKNKINNKSSHGYSKFHNHSYSFTITFNPQEENKKEE